MVVPCIVLKNITEAKCKAASIEKESKRIVHWAAVAMSGKADFVLSALQMADLMVELDLAKKSSCDELLRRILCCNCRRREGNRGDSIFRPQCATYVCMSIYLGLDKTFGTVNGILLSQFAQNFWNIDINNMMVSHLNNNCVYHKRTPLHFSC